MHDTIVSTLRSKSPTMAETIRGIARERIESKLPGLKINLYKDCEVEALAVALNHLPIRKGCRIETIMVGDSYLMTHLGRSSTRLATRDEQRWGLEIMLAQVNEVREAMDRYLADHRRPYLIGDMPDGAATTPEIALIGASRMLEAGADVIKLEIVSDDSLRALEKLVRCGVPVVAHVGYTPQCGENRRYGDTLEEARVVFGTCRTVRDLGACAVTLEMVSEPVNRALSVCSANSLPVYSIFSGKARHGAQSLNVWDSVFLAASGRKYFPPTAEYPTCRYPEVYTPEVISRTLTRLLELTIAGDFPLSPPSRMNEIERARLRALDPWNETFDGTAT